MPIVYDYDARICANNPQGHGNCRVCCLLLAAVSRKTSSGVRRLFLTHARHRVTDSADLSFNLGEPAFLWIQDVLLILPCTFSFFLLPWTKQKGYHLDGVSFLETPLDQAWYICAHRLQELHV